MRHGVGAAAQGNGGAMGVRGSGVWKADVDAVCGWASYITSQVPFKACSAERHSSSLMSDTDTLC